MGMQPGLHALERTGRGSQFCHIFLVFRYSKEARMKMLRMLPLLSVALFPFAPASVEEMPQLVLPDTEMISCQDQAMCGKCGDGACVRQCGETATSCPADCGGVAL
jgi:hypothetical protein